MSMSSAARCSCRSSSDSSSVTQDLFANLGGERHRFQFRVDMINLGNLLNDNWGVSQRPVSNSPLIVPTAAQAVHRRPGPHAVPHARRQRPVDEPLA